MMRAWLVKCPKLTIVHLPPSLVARVGAYCDLNVLVYAVLRKDGAEFCLKIKIKDESLEDLSRGNLQKEVWRDSRVCIARHRVVVYRTISSVGGVQMDRQAKSLYGMEMFCPG